MRHEQFMNKEAHAWLSIDRKAKSANSQTAQTAKQRISKCARSPARSHN